MPFFAVIADSDEHQWFGRFPAEWVTFRLVMILGCGAKRFNGCNIYESMTVPESLNRADRVRGEVSQILQGEYKDDTRLMVLLAYVALAIEHHEAIGLLVRSKLLGSAFSLTRVVFEILFCAHWVARCASDKDLEKIAFKGNFEFPGMGTIVKDVDTAFGTHGFFEEIKKKAWKGMNSYTHSGLLQLAKRFKESKVEPNYSDEAIMETVDAITAALLLLGRLLADAVGRAGEVDKLDKLLEDFGNDRLRPG